jgi:hypothetical protein
MIGTDPLATALLFTKSGRLLALFIPHSRAAHRFALAIALGFS